ncbi:nucleoside hydrolase [Cohnella fermenti]|uniref:Nucleoside hydrolase n=1 Tax=Cohnella fermenti TaxID=2565925 RepID=A0A4S4BSV8_9BACL|nr:nucleoside hydrolase [Cohnella fermenti]THF77341.1 nucleoside hydrolase [Cohnella fermenti]
MTLNPQPNSATPKLSQEQLLRRLARPEGKIRIVLDTDTYNEIDDQFAVVYALKSPERMKVEALYAAPFHNDRSDGPKDGMEKSYRELQRIAKLLPEAEGVPILRGSDRYLPDSHTAVASEAAKDLVKRALESPENDPLYVVSIGAITNVASALLMEPSIASRIVIVWLGGHALEWTDTNEFNMMQDYAASSLILNSGAPLVLLPCMGVSSHLLTTLSEIREFVKDSGPIGQYLYDTFRDCNDDHYAYSRVIWDIATIAYLIDDSFAPSVLIHSPVLSEDMRWSKDERRHWIRYVYYLHRDLVFRDLFRKLVPRESEA